MIPTSVRAPVALLCHPDLTAAAKLIWLAMRGSRRPVTLSGLAVRLQMSRSTVRRSLGHLQAAGWSTPADGVVSGDAVAVPLGLIAEARVRPQAKLLYGLLQTLPSFSGVTGRFSYAGLSAAMMVSVVTARASVRELAEEGWVTLSQEGGQLAPVEFTLLDPVGARMQAQVGAMDERLKEADYRGEELMREYLSLLIDSDRFEDNARPGFLINPLTGHAMELDRFYYALDVAFEFNGEQHDRTTQIQPSVRRLAMQQARDKRDLCPAGNPGRDHPAGGSGSQNDAAEDW